MFARVKANGLIAVSSETHPSRKYTVNVRKPSCTCPHWTKKLGPLWKEGGKKVCKHLQFAKGYILDAEGEEHEAITREMV